MYNTEEEYLREAIESILNQTFDDFEFLILDDGSTNNANDVIFSYKDPRIKYIQNNENKGIIFTLNKGRKLASGEYIARMDSDDISLHERFYKQVIFLDNNPDISLVGAWFYGFPNPIVGKYPQKVTYLNLLRNCCIGHPAVMYRKADFEKYNLEYSQNFIHAEDYDLWSRAIKHLKMENLQEFLIKYRIREDSISNKFKDIQQLNTERIQQNMLEFLTDDKLLQKKIRDLL